MVPGMITRFSSSITFKVLLIGALTCAMAIPLLLIAGLTFERQSRRATVEQELGVVWGQRQTAGGVALVVPYQIPASGPEGTVVASGRVVVLPKVLTVDAELTPEVRRRSIFAVNLYRARLTVAGHFVPPDLGRIGLGSATLLWDRAAFHTGLSDLRGATSASTVTWGAEAIELEPAGESGPFGSGLRAPAPAAPGAATLPFRFEVVVAGSGALKFLPAGDATTVALRSPWPHPSFSGGFLPTEQTVSPEGFTAAWRLSALSRPYPQAWVMGSPSDQSVTGRFQSSAFGVDLVTTVDHYQQVFRAIKYGFLFIALTFGIFLTWEVLSKLRLHPIQYLFVGLTLVVFFLLLLSLSEHIAFVWAYSAAAAATILAVAGYAWRILAAGRAGAAVGGWLTALYGVLFVLLQLEDLALLVGSVTVFLILVAAMYLTRGVDWYGTGVETDRAAE
jgi:inner membrane protein